MKLVRLANSESSVDSKLVHLSVVMIIDLLILRFYIYCHNHACLVM